MVKKSEADIIIVWYCENCGSYALDFDSDKKLCLLDVCRYKMTKRTYKEVIK